MANQRIDIEPISSMKRAAALVKRVKETRRPLYVTQNGRAAVVIQDVESFQEREEALALLKLSIDGDRAIDEGHAKSLSAFRKSSRRRIRELAKRRDLE